MFSYCLNYLGIHFFINAQHFIVVNIPSYFKIIALILCCSLCIWLFCDFVRLYGSSAPITFIYYSWVYSLYMSDTNSSPCLFIPFLAVICVNITPTAILWISCMNYFLFVLVLVNWVSYFFPPHFILRCLTPFPEFPLYVSCLCYQDP